MNLLFRVVFASAAHSTHHKLALDSLRHLQGPAAERWQKLFLKNYIYYLEGSKVPDKEFKDFRNHVLHVRDNDWGGAPQTARKWYRQLLAELRVQNWPQAVWTAGVLSHYYMDPIQPFHTAQSTAESNIHRAAEWSISRAYDAIRAQAEGIDVPKVTVPDGRDWLERMVKAGANLANPHYETLIAHYDLKKGVKDPPAGLDGVSIRILSELTSYAAVGFARILERAFEESNARPPEVEIKLQGFLAALQIPIFWVTRKLHDAADRRTVEAMYRELKKTGRVEETLPEDDRMVRDLHKREVLDRKTKARPPAATRMDPATEPAAAISRRTPTLGNRPAKARRARYYLHESDPVVDAPSIGPTTARRLAPLGVETVADLLRVDPAAAAAKTQHRYITEEAIRDWQDQAKLVCQVANLRGHDAQILVACGIRTPNELVTRSAEPLLEAVLDFVGTSQGKRILRSGKQPDLVEVRNWIRWANESRQRAA